MNILDEAPSPSPSDLCLLLSLFSDHYAANNKTFRGRADFDSGDDLTLLNIYNAYVSRSGVAHHSQRAVWRERDPVGIAAYEDTPDDFVVTGVDDGDIIGGLGCQPELFSVWCHTQPMGVLSFLGKLRLTESDAIYHLLLGKIDNESAVEPADGLISTLAVPSECRYTWPGKDRNATDDIKCGSVE